MSGGKLPYFRAFTTTKPEKILQVITVDLCRWFWYYATYLNHAVTSPFVTECFL